MLRHSLQQALLDVERGREGAELERARLVHYAEEVRCHFTWWGRERRRERWRVSMIKRKVLRVDKKRKSWLESHEIL